MSINYSLTAAGLHIMALGQTGREIKFTSIVLGDGLIPEGQTAADMIGLVNEVIVVPIVDCSAPSNGMVKITGLFSNADLATGFLYREIGAKAINPENGEEVLYCYGNAGELAEWIGAYGTPKLIEKTINLHTVVGKAANVTAVIDSAAALTRVALDEHIHNREPHPMIDCGYFDDENVTGHSLNAAAHANMTVDGNAIEASSSDGSLQEHEVNPTAHKNLIVDGNTTT